MLTRIRDLLRRAPDVGVTRSQLGYAAIVSVVVTLTVMAASGFSFARVETGPAPLVSQPPPAGVVRASLALTGAPVEGTEDLIRLQDLSPEAARLWNASNPISDLPNPAAKPFMLKTEGVLDEARAVDCMTAAIYYEAAYESLDGQRAVAQVVLNRMRHPAFPKTVCGVVFQGSDRTTGCQFTFTCDGSLARKPNDEVWARTRKVAVAALNGYVMKSVGNATHYHAAYVAPYWSPSLVKVANIGAHIFYRWTGGWGQPPAFGGRYAGGESTGIGMATLDGLSKDPAKLTLAANATEAATATPEPVADSEPATETAKSAPELVVAANAIAPESQMTKAEDLDWQGRPRQRGAPRIATPGGGMGPPKF